MISGNRISKGERMKIVYLPEGRGGRATAEQADLCHRIPERNWRCQISWKAAEQGWLKTGVIVESLLRAIGLPRWH